MPDSTYFDLPAAPDPNASFSAGPYLGTYRSMEGSRHTIEKFTFLGTEIIVRDGGDGTLLVGSTSYVELESGQFQYAGGGPYYLAFGSDDTGEASHLFMGGGALERVPWQDTLRATMGALAASGVLLLSAILIWPFAGVVGRRRGWERHELHPGRWIIIVAAAACLLYLVGFGWIFSQTDFQDFFKGVPSSITYLLVLPMTAVPLAFLAFARSVRASITSKSSIPMAFGSARPSSKS